LRFVRGNGCGATPLCFSIVPVVLMDRDGCFSVLVLAGWLLPRKVYAPPCETEVDE